MKFFGAAARTLTTGALMALAGSAAAQQAYPNKSIRFITPYAPGGTTTALARLIGQKLSESWGQPVIVENRPGGNTIIGSEFVAKSAPDGYTIMLMGGTHVVMPLLHEGVPYDAIKDFAPVATVSSNEQLLVLHPSVPVKTVQEFIALAKSRPGQLNYASAGTGSVPHMAAELFKLMTGTKIQEIPYKGGAPAVTDLIGGQVQMFFSTPINVIAHIRSSRLKAIAVSGETRLPGLPQVPTFTEAGLPGFEAKGWFGVLAPAGTPKPIVDRLSSEIARILVMQDVKDKLLSQGMDPFVSSPEQFASLMKAETAKSIKIIRAAGIKIEK